MLLIIEIPDGIEKKNRKNRIKENKIQSMPTILDFIVKGGERKISFCAINMNRQLNRYKKYADISGEENMAATGVILVLCFMGLILALKYWVAASKNISAVANDNVSVSSTNQQILGM